MYKSKLKLLIKMEEEKMKDLKENISQLNQQKNQIINQIEEEEGEKRYSFVKSKLGTTLPSSFFSSTVPHFRLMNMKNEVKKIEEQIEEVLELYYGVKKKWERLIEENKRREQEYHHEMEKREQKQLEELFLLKKEKNKRQF